MHTRLLAIHFSIHPALKCPKQRSLHENLWNSNPYKFYEHKITIVSFGSIKYCFPSTDPNSFNWWMSPSPPLLRLTPAAKLESNKSRPNFPAEVRQVEICDWKYILNFFYSQKLVILNHDFFTGSWEVRLCSLQLFH